MKRLGLAHYENVLPLLKSVPFNALFAIVVAQQKVHGTIFADSEIEPTVCLVVHKYGMSFLVGEHANSRFNSSLADFLLNGPQNNSTAKWMLTYPEPWENTLAELLGDRLRKKGDALDPPARQVPGGKYVIQTRRVNFRFREDLFVTHTILPKGFNLKNVDEIIYPQVTGSVVPYNFWDTCQDFLDNAIGFSLVSDQGVVSTSFASFIDGAQLELGVETDPAFRGRSYALYPCTSLINYCLAAGYEPLWACSEDNVGSFKLALKLGFTPETYHPYYVIPVS